MLRPLPLLAAATVLVCLPAGAQCLEQLVETPGHFGLGFAVAADGDQLAFTGHVHDGQLWIGEWSAQRQTWEFPFVENHLFCLDSAGRAVDIDGDWAVVASPSGACSLDDNLWIYGKDESGTWDFAQFQQLKHSLSGHFGRGIAVDGDTIMVGDPLHSATLGALHVFQLQGEHWLHTQLHLASSSFGRAIALEGDLAAAGAPSAFESGEVYLYERSSSDWEYAGPLTQPGPRMPGDKFGWSLAHDGSLLVVGARGVDVDGRENAGAAFVYERVGNVWVAQATLTARVPSRMAAFGSSVALLGEQIIVGAPHARSLSGSHASLAPDPVGFLGERRGAAHLFERTPDGWTEVARFEGLEEGQALGHAVALSAHSVIAGAPALRTLEDNDGVFFWSMEDCVP